MKELIILGSGLSRIECTYDKEVWGINRVYKFARRLDKMFCADPVVELEELEEYQEKLGFEIVSSCRHPKLEVTLYPIEEVMEHFQTDFFSDTACYMLALALKEGYGRIFLYGVDMHAEGEYGDGKGGVEYWVGRAIGMGVQIVNTKLSSVAKSRDGKLYGYWEDRDPYMQELEKANAGMLRVQRFPPK